MYSSLYLSNICSNASITLPCSSSTYSAFGWSLLITSIGAPTRLEEEEPVNINNQLVIPILRTHQLVRWVGGRARIRRYSWRTHDPLVWGGRFQSASSPVFVGDATANLGDCQPDRRCRPHQMKLWAQWANWNGFVLYIKGSLGHYSHLTPCVWPFSRNPCGS